MTIKSNTKQLVLKLQKNQRAAMTNSPQLNEAFLRIGLRIQAQARLNVTNKKIVDTGSLRSGINYRFFKEGSRSGIQIGVFGIPYAAINEFGGVVSRDMLRAMWAANRNKPKKPSKNVIKIAQGAQTGTWRARPYLIPAFRQEKNFIINTLAQALGFK